MATKLYGLNSAASGYISGSLPGGERSGATADANGAFGAAIAIMRSTKGPGGSRRSLTSVASAAAKKYWLQSWVSMPLEAQTINPASITFSMAGKESNLNANFAINSFHVFVWRPSTGALVGTLIDQPNAGATTAAAEPAAINVDYVMQSVISSGISSVACQVGDVIVVELWALVTQSSATSYTDNTYYGGTTENTTNGAIVSGSMAAYVEFSQTLLFANIQEGVGSSSAALSVAGVGTPVRGGVGAAAAVLTVEGASINYQQGAGAATCALSVAGVGVGITGAVGAAAMSLAVEGVWDLSSIVNQGVGAAAMGLTVEGVGVQYFPHVFMQESPAGDGWTKETAL